MNTKLLLTTLFVSVLAFTACNNDNQIESSSDNEIKIITSIGNQTKAIIDADGKGAFENGDEILLRWENYNGQGASGDYAIGETQMYWDQYFHFQYPPIKFSACYQKGKIPTTVGVLVYFNVATEQEKDLLVAIPDTVNAKEPVNLKFIHAMHKLNINLTSNVFTSDDLKYAEVSLESLKSVAVVSLPLGLTYLSAAEGSDPYEPQTGAKTSFIVAPQEITSGDDFIKIEIAGVTYTYKVPASLNVLDYGKILTLNLAINRDAVTLENTTISGWENQDTINGGISY